MLNIEFSSQSKKFLKKCGKELSNRIIKKIDLLKIDPVPHDSVKVVGEERTFRVRVGDYRLLYEVRWNEKILLISKIDKRAKVY